MSRRAREKGRQGEGEARSPFLSPSPCPRVFLSPLLLAFLVVGLLYSLTVPVFEAPDENAHFAYARYLAETGHLPVQDPANPGPWSQEGSQPPLYYAVVALVIRSIDTSDVETLRWKNPQNVMGHPAVPGNKNRFIHTDQERFPYQGAVLAVHLARLVSLLMGAGTVWLTYLIARQVFADQPASALAAAAFVTFLPQFLFISAAVNNDNAVTLLSTATLYCLSRLVSGPKYRSRQVDKETSRQGPPCLLAYLSTCLPALGLGACLGLALLSKLSALLLVPFIVLILAMIAWRRRSIRWFLVVILMVLGVATLIAGWWFLRNLWLYGDPVATNVMMEFAGRRRFELEEFLIGAWDEFRGLRWSFWGLFGWFSLPLPQMVYLILDVLTLLAGLGLIVWGLRRLTLRLRSLARRPGRAGQAAERRPPASEQSPFFVLRSSFVVLLLWLLVVFSGLIWWTAFAQGAQGRLLFPAIAPIAVLMVAGWRAWLPQRVVSALPALVGLPMLAFAAWCLFGVIRPAYARPPLVDAAAIPADVTRPELIFDGKIRLLGVGISPTDVAPGGTVNLAFYWQALAPVTEDALLNIRLFGHDMALLVNEDTYPGWGTFPPTLWPVGPVIVDRYRFDLPVDADGPTLVRVDVRFVDRATRARWPATDARGQPVPSPTFVASFRLRRPAAAGSAQQPVARLDDGIILQSYQVAPGVVHAGESVTVTLALAAEAAPATDYTVFTHLVDADGRIVAQADGPPRKGDYPTSAWLPGDRVPDQRVIQVPSDAPPGEYHLLVGMYRLETGQRLPAYDADGRRWPDDAVRLPVAIAVEP